MILTDTGISSGHYTAADIFFLIAAILCVIGAVIAYSVKAMWATLVAAGIACVAIGLLLT